MTNQLLTYTSTGAKIFQHNPLLLKLKAEIPTAYPITLQVAPTSRCNLKCSFCSNAKRNKHEDLDINVLKRFILDLKKIGLKAVEITGGGDPTMYDEINELISFCHKIKLDVGMITNGILLGKVIEKENLDILKWVRISANSLEYTEEFNIPEIKGTLGFSLCMHENIQAVVHERLTNFVNKYKPSYVRVVPDCLPSDSEETVRRCAKEFVEFKGRPYFYQDKHFQRPDRCYWHYLKPFLLHDGYVYPCSSVVLNSGSEGVFHHRYRWIHMSDLLSKYKKEMVSFNTVSCNRCVFTEQNVLIDSIIHPSGMENFI